MTELEAPEKRPAADRQADSNDAPRPTTVRFSASRLKTYSECPLKGHFKYDELIPEPQNAKATYGVIIHDALRLYNETGDLDAAKKHFRTGWENPERLGLAPDWWPKGATYGGLRSQGVEVLERYHESLMWDTREVIACEHPFLVPFGRYELTGFVDLLELRRSGNGRRTLRVIDYKGGSFVPRQLELHLDLQFTTYMLAVDQPEFWTGDGTPKFPPLPGGLERYEELRDVPRRAIWYHLNSQKEIDAGPRKDEDFFRMYRLCEEIVRAERAKVFVPRIGSACQLCSFTKECGIEVPARGEHDDESWL